MGLTLRQLIEKVPPEIKAVVQSVKTVFNDTVRNTICDDARLVLSGVSVPVKILPGSSDVIFDFEFSDEQTLFLYLAPWRNHLAQLVASGEAVLSGLIRPNPVSPIDWATKPFASIENQISALGADLPDVIKHAKSLLEIIDRERLLEDLYKRQAGDQQVLTNVFGSYNTAPPTIELYWGAIGYFAPLLGTSVEGLALLTLAHEWGHAYSHVGADIPGVRWETHKFRLCDIYVQEGLAQYYAERVVEKLQSRMFGGLDAYRKLLPRQPPEYRTHEQWKDFTPEEVRFAMLAVRQKDMAMLADFNLTLVEARNKLRGSGIDPSIIAPLEDLF